MNKHVPPDTIVDVRMPTLLPGKTYRTREGRTAQLLNDHGAGHNMPFRIMVSGDVCWAHRDGSFQFFGQADQMLPGAIEDEKPTFEPGKSYRTRKGDVVKIVRRIAGSADYPLQGEHHVQCWTLAGRYWKEAKGECSADLMPGAVEDEPAIPQQVGNNVDTTAIFKVLESHQRQIDTARREIAVLASGANMDTACINAVERRLTTMELLEQASVTGNRNYAHDEGARRRIGSVEKYCEALQARIEDQTKHQTAIYRDINTMAKVRDNDRAALTKRIESLEKVSELRTNLHIDVIQRICALENYTGLDVRSAPPPTARTGDGGGMIFPPKRTIKGGWVNVYPGRFADGGFWFGCLYQTREKADAECAPNRLACIQIPDITEGEGL